MLSIRERIIRAVVQRLQNALSPTPVLRQPTIALTRVQAPALIVGVESDAPVRRVNDCVERELRLRLTAVARDAAAADGFAVADDIICRAHNAIFADVTLGGLALGVSGGEADYQAEDADLDACAIPAVYVFVYRTLVHDITLES